MTTRPATTEDLAAIMVLERAAFPTDAWSEAMMRQDNILTADGSEVSAWVEGALEFFGNADELSRAA